MLRAVLRVAELFRSQEEPKLERHVEPRQSGLTIDAGTRDVMDAELGFLNNLQNLGDTNLAAVVHFKC